ncbi:ROK family transcriptional regulator [Brucella pseudogrignonensis]|uniref:ROK family transcriptional regulator n=1 Tax=Brucella pseudogrignonensis TaxID=419475 RepID=UPI0038CFEF72
MSSVPELQPGPILTASARAIFHLLAQRGSQTRPQLGEVLGLSRPTLSAAIAELELNRLVIKTGERQGQVGRRASIYRVAAEAGHVIAIDAGSTHIRLRISALDRRLLHSRVYRLPESQFLLGEEISMAVAEEVEATLAATESSWGPLRALGIALPARVVGKQGDTHLTRETEIFSRFTPPDDVALILENNVNCAAVAEHFNGAAQGVETFAYVQIGLKMGMGIMLGGKVLRGRNGAAGEIGHLAFPFGTDRRPLAGEMERYIGTHDFMQRVLTQWPSDAEPAPQDAAELMSLYAAGNEAAIKHVTRHAEDIGAVVASCVAIVDPGLVVLGGGLGGNLLLRPIVEETANSLSYPVEVRVSTLGSDATVLGIEKLACDHAVKSVLGEPISPPF